MKTFIQFQDVNYFEPNSHLRVLGIALNRWVSSLHKLEVPGQILIIFFSIKSKHHNLSLFFLLFCLFRAAPMAYGGSQARGPIGAAAASLRHSHSNARSELRL